MIEISDREILAWLARALEPGRVLELEASLADPEMVARVALLRSELQDAADTWRVPPPALTRGATTVRRSGVLGRSVDVHVRGAGDGFILVLTRAAGRLLPVFPTIPAPDAELVEAHRETLLRLELPDDADRLVVLAVPRHWLSQPWAGVAHQVRLAVEEGACEVLALDLP
ncbi:MAG: hypothetical protein H6736_21695 [Alphaproteobacteria bacterium]|nr:hypothetical protein [Alphaproteobacteria bacterium]MCB9694431.1 hypothetical protein [Alphaproteobacteria bacterium]